MTLAELKRELPSVPVKINGKGPVVWARLSGRLCEDATVTVLADSRKPLRGAPWCDNHYAWRTVLDAVNAQRPLHFPTFGGAA